MKIYLRLPFTWPAMIFTRKFGLSGLRSVILFILVIFAFYVTTSFYSLNNEKISSLELFNETVNYMETPVAVNTETSNVEMRKQHSVHVYERPHLINETVTAIHSIQVGDIVPNCGYPKVCGNNEFVVHLYSGKDHSDEPKLCIDGKYVLGKDVNDGGRGVNVAVVDNMTRTIIRVVHFDTYEKDSIALETLLLTLRPGDIVILMTFDEPSRKLSRIARLLLYDLGSALIQNLSYRGSWYLITQKGISGFSPFEELHYVEASGWPRHHDVKFCVPFELKGTVVHPDPLTSNNQMRVEFCEKHDDLPLFCDADVVNDPLLPAPIWKQPSSINKIYNVPIIVMSGENVQFLPLTLETLIHQPGIKPSIVVVFHLAKNSMVQNLSELFGFLSEELTETSNYCERVSEAFDIASVLYPDAREAIFIGENVVLAPDFMFYLGQLLSVLNSDSTISAVSALNENGFQHLSGDPTLAYRVETFFSLAFLVRKDFFQKSWCHNKSGGVPLNEVPFSFNATTLIPDVSRVTIASPMASNFSVSSVLLAHDKTITYEQNIMLKSPESLVREEYDQVLKGKLESAIPIKLNDKLLKVCLMQNGDFLEKFLNNLPLLLNQASNSSSNQVLAIYFLQTNEEDVLALQYLIKCTGLFYHPLYPVRGLYKGIVRFMLKNHQAFFVGSKSPFFAFQPERVPVVKFDFSCNCLITLML